MTESKKWSVVSGPGVWMEGEALEQLKRLTTEPHVSQVVGMPDLHPGPNSPIGAVVSMERRLWPVLLGGDLGCGVKVFLLPKIKVSGGDLQRRIERAFGQYFTLDCDPQHLMEAVWRHGPKALSHLPGVPASLAELAALEPEGHEVNSEPPPAEYARQIGSIGSGNHFLELSKIAKSYESGPGLKRGGFAVIAHSGSRGLGKFIAGKWGGVRFHEDDATPWLNDLRGAMNYSATNRLVLCWRMLEVVKMARANRVSASFDLVHNTVERRGSQWIHRKGAAPAHDGQLTVVLGSRGTPSFIMRGCGNEGCLCSVAHGAGRKLDRAKSLALMKHRYKRAEMTKTAIGSRVFCTNKEALFTEHPDAYKDIFPVITALEDFAAATRVAELHPIFTVKA